jgi:nucleoid DNA-binding protein
MDIDLLSKMVKELILDEDRVVLPGLGCFVAEIVPSSFSDKGYTINPPYRRLYFRARPDEGDALIDFYAKSNNLDYSMAERILKDFLMELKSVLHARKAVVFPGLGRLRATKENNLFFVADEDLDIYPEGFGLEPISLKTHNESAEEVSAAVIGLKSMLVSESPIVTSEPEMTVEPEVTAEALPVEEPTPAAVPEEVVEPEPVQDVVPETVTESEVLPEPVSETEPEVVSEPEAVPEPVIVPVPVVEPELPVETVSKAAVQHAGQNHRQEVKKPRSGSVMTTVLLTLLGVAVLLVAAYVIVGHMCPEWIDRFLYSPEELKILNHR